MPKVITEETIERIAELAGKGYSKAAVGRELDLDRATVRKYWPQEKEVPVSSLDDEFARFSRKQEALIELEELVGKAKREWETEALRKKGNLSLQKLNFLKGKLEKAEPFEEIERIGSLVREEGEKVLPFIEEDERLGKERLEEEKKKRQEEFTRRRKADDLLYRMRLNHLAWVFPCREEHARALIAKFFEKYDGYEEGLRTLREMLAEADALEEGSSLVPLQPLVEECVNMVKGNPQEKSKIAGILLQRKERILRPEDENLEQAFQDWLNAEDEEEFVEGVFRLNAAFCRLADERYIDTDEIMAKEDTYKRDAAS